MKVLISYAGRQNRKEIQRILSMLQDECGEAQFEVFADSGAFSVKSIGATVDIDNYADWLTQWGSHFSAYANLDVLQNPKKTYENQKYLEGRGLAPLPVFHAGSEFRHLQRYLDEGYRYIALGGLVPHMSRVKTLTRWIIRCFEMAQGRAVFHGFGCTGWSYAKKFPWYSADSSSWTAGVRYGRLALFDMNRGRWQTATVGDKDSCLALRKLFREHGYGWADFADRGRLDYARSIQLAAIAYARAEKYLQDRHGEIVIPVGVEAPGMSLPPLHSTGCGLKTYLATGASAKNEISKAVIGLKAYGLYR